jgi:hypothetical protein
MHRHPDFGANSYTFLNFHQLVILLNQIQQGIIPEGGVSLPTGPVVICEGAVKIFRLPNGDLEVYSGFDVLPSNGWLIGVIPAGTEPAGQIFSNPAAPILGWTVVFNANRSISVFNADGVLISDVCRV